MPTSSWNLKQALYLRNNAVSYWLGAVGPAILLYLILPHGQFQFFNSWMICMISVATISMIWRRAVHKRLLEKQISWLIFNLISIYILAVSASLWAYISFYVFSKLGFQEQAFICMMITGIAAGSIPVNASSKLLSQLTIPAMVSPLALAAFSANSPYGNTLGAGSIIYLFVLLRSSAVFHNTLKKEHELSEHNNDLRLQLEEKAARLVSQAQHTTLGNMAGNMAHEINNPLTTLIANVDLLKIRLNTNLNKEQIENILQKIQSNIQRMTRIMKSLKHFSSPESGHEYVEEKINSILSRTALLCQERLDADGINLIMRGGSYSLFVECRPSEICHALLNLINNSREAISKLNNKWIRIESQRVGDAIEIRITDSGEGIKSDIQNKIMEPFFTTKDVGQNVGLGLSVAAAIIKAHHGTIRLDATSQNTSFVIYLPSKVKSQTIWNQII